MKTPLIQRLAAVLASAVTTVVLFSAVVAEADLGAGAAPTMARATAPLVR